MIHFTIFEITSFDYNMFVTFKLIFGSWILVQMYFVNFQVGWTMVIELCDYSVSLDNYLFPYLKTMFLHLYF